VLKVIFYCCRGKVLFSVVCVCVQNDIVSVSCTSLSNTFRMCEILLLLNESDAAVAVCVAECVCVRCVCDM